MDAEIGHHRRSDYEIYQDEGIDWKDAERQAGQRDMSFDKDEQELASHMGQTYQMGYDGNLKELEKLN